MSVTKEELREQPSPELLRVMLAVALRQLSIDEAADAYSFLANEFRQEMHVEAMKGRYAAKVRGKLWRFERP